MNSRYLACLIVALMIAAAPLAASPAVPSGNMAIRFRTLGTLDFTNLRYIVVFNTSGNGQGPLATQISGFLNYSFELIFGGTNVGGASYQLLQVVPTGTSPGYQQISVPIRQQYVTFNSNSDGTGNEFTFMFNRLLIAPIAATAPVATLWDLNFFSTDTNGNPIDAIATNGIQDVTFNDKVNTTQPSDQVFSKPLGAAQQVNPQSAQVIVVEVINMP